MTEKVDVLVVGAGIAWIDAGYHLQNKGPDRKLAMREGRERRGGTWELLKGRGRRSDWDMYA